MILGHFGGLGGSRQAILAPMLGDVGCKMGPRWVQEAFESEFFAQLGVLMGSGVENLGEAWRNLEERGRTWVGRRQRRGP